MSLALVLAVLFLGFPEGAVAQEFLISSSASGVDDKAPDVAFGGDRFLVVWSRGAMIIGARVLTDGTVLDDGGIPFPGLSSVYGNSSEFQPAVSFDGTNFVTVCSSSIFDMFCSLDRHREYIFASRVTEDGVVDSSPTILSTKCTASGSLDSPDIAFDGVNYLAAWSNFAWALGSRVDGAVVTPGLSASALAVSPFVGDITGGVSRPAVAFDGTDSLVVWLDYRDLASWEVYGARVTPGGTVLDPDSFRVSPGGVSAESPAVAYGSPVYLVVWVSGDVIYGTRVSTDGTVLDTDGFVIGEGSAPAVSQDGTNFLVVWKATTPEPAIHGAWVSPAGEAGMPFVLAGVGAGVWDASLSVAFDGERFLVTFAKAINGNFDIYGIFVGAEMACTDDDGDGYGSSTDPDCIVPNDCNDDPSTDPPECPSQGGSCACGEAECAGCAVCTNPDGTDFPGDGFDSDCDGQEPGYAATANTMASRYGSGSLAGSGLFNAAGLLLIPLGAFVLLRRLRGRG